MPISPRSDSPKGPPSKTLKTACWHILTCVLVQLQTINAVARNIGSRLYCDERPAEVP